MSTLRASRLHLTACLLLTATGTASFAATLEAPRKVQAGAEITVQWSATVGEGDFISLDPSGAPDHEYGDWVYPGDESTVTFQAPGAPGSYAVRYHSGGAGYKVLATAPVEVVAATATVRAPASAAAGATIEVSWDGPLNQGDFVSIDPAGAPDHEYGAYVYADRGNPASLPAPDSAGPYEVRYHLGASGYAVIGSSPLTVSATSASVKVATPVVAGETFEVAFTGPNNENDFITIVPEGAAEREYGNWAATRLGSPAKLEAPKRAGRYEVRYATGQDYRTLARAAVEVSPGRRGSLRVVGRTGGTAPTAPGAVEVILDASGSMLQKIEGTRRIELARAALLDLTGSALPAGTPFALRVFGHREANSCRTDLELPLAALDPAKASATIGSIEAKNLAKTPIADSLRRVREDLAAASGRRVVVLITDGEETCGGDPAAAIRELRQAGIEVEVSIVGFAIDQLALKEQFRSWAKLGGGLYLDAADGEALQKAVRGAVATSFDVVQGGKVITTGAVGGPAIDLPAGGYAVQVAGRTVGEVSIAAGKEVAFTLPH